MVKNVKYIDKKREKEHNKNIVKNILFKKVSLRFIKIISKSGAKNEDKQGFYDQGNSR